MKDIQRAAHAVLEQLEAVIYGKRSVLARAFVCLLSGGHLLLEDVPGTAKTLLGKALARTLGGRFRRLQCTPDLLPGDATGTHVFNQKTSDFEFHAGPVFCHVLLADEINRATPRAQAALLECMAERQVSIENKTYQLERPFFVIATQNPIEHEGTFALPEAQLDRFTMRLSLGYPSAEAEERMLREGDAAGEALDRVEQVLSLEVLRRLQETVREVYVHPEVRGYIVQLVAGTRDHGDLMLGAGPRATQSLYRASQAAAAVAGRGFVLPDDAKGLLSAVLEHRLVLGAGGRLGKRSTAHVVDEILRMTPVPIVEPSARVAEG